MEKNLEIGLAAKITQTIHKIQGLMDKTKVLKADQIENKNIIKNIIPNLVQAISQISNFLIFLFNLLNTYLTSFIYYNKIVSLLIKASI